MQTLRHFLSRVRARSLCKAAAIVAVIRVAMFPLRVVLLGRHALCLRCFLRRFQEAVGYATSYAICFIGIYGLDFSEGAAAHPNLPRATWSYLIIPWAVNALRMGLFFGDCGSECPTWSPETVGCKSCRG